MKTKLFLVTLSFLLAVPAMSSALTIPKDGSELAEMDGVDAQAYIVTDVTSGQMLIGKNVDMPWTPASLTKLVTALVVLDTKPKFTKLVTMSSADQSIGQCTSGGACIKAKAGVKFTVDGLFHALLLPSANNAANALARSTGLSAADFAIRMNQKAASLGAVNSHFNEPTGLDATNQITAGDYSKILVAAFANPYLTNIAGLSRYYLRSSNNSRYNQTIKSTDKLLADADVSIIGAKTGYLPESKYNFSALANYRGGQELAIVVLGENHLYTAFDETKLLASLAGEAIAIAFLNQAVEVLGASTP